MEPKVEIETEREVLKRTVALLFSFAILAEQASGRSYPVRCLILWFLRRAEAVARTWLLSDSPHDLQSAPSPCGVLHRNSKAEVMQLARSFRMLARTLRRELRLEQRLARRLMRSKVDRTAAETHPHSLLTPDSFYRLALTTRAAMRCAILASAPRFDTS